jgi:hypothetical protein
MPDYIFKSMYKRYFLLLFLLVFCVEAPAQERKLPEVDFPQQYSMVIKTNPFPMVLGPIPFTSEFRLANEFVVAPNQSSQISIAYLGKGYAYNLLTGSNNRMPSATIVRGFRIQVSHRIFLNKVLESIGFTMPEYAPEGFYIGPLFSYSTAKFSDRYNINFDRYYRITHTNLNLVFGYQLITYHNISMDFFTGFGYKENVWLDHTTRNPNPMPTPRITPNYASNLKLLLGMNFGYAF